MNQELSIHTLLATHAVETPEAIALTAPGRRSLTYSRLAWQAERSVRSLTAMGIGRAHRVGLGLPNGPEAAVAFLSVASGATCAPLNPALTAAEFDFYLSDPNTRALISQRPVSSQWPSR